MDSDLSLHFFCPLCAEPFSTRSIEAAPHGLSCGHVCCLACAEAQVILAKPACMLCNQSISDEFVMDAGLMQFMDALAQADDANADLVSVDAVGSDDVPLEPASASKISTNVSSGTIKESGSSVDTVTNDAFTTCAKHSNAPFTHYCPYHCSVLCESCILDGHSDHEGSLLSLADADVPPLIHRQLSRSRENCVLHADRAFRSHIVIEASKVKLLDRKERALEHLTQAVNEVKSNLDTHVAVVTHKVNKLCNSRVKALDAQLDALMVTAGQLKCAAAMCTRAIQTLGDVDGKTGCDEAGGEGTSTLTLAVPTSTWKPSTASSDLLNAALALQSTVRSCSVLQSSKLPFVETAIDVVVKPGATLASLRRFCEIVSKVDPADITVQGTGLRYFSQDVPNEFVVLCQQSTDRAISTDDILVEITLKKMSNAVNSLSAHALTAALRWEVVETNPSLFTITYTVTDPDITDICVELSVCGLTSIGNGPWTVTKLPSHSRVSVKCWGALNHPVRTLNVNPDKRLDAVSIRIKDMAVASDESRLVVSTLHQLLLYSLPELNLIHSATKACTSTFDSALFPFQGVCFVPGSHNFVVACVSRASTKHGASESFVLECDGGGSSVREIQSIVLGYAQLIACDGIHIAVTRNYEAGIALLDYVSGSVVRVIGTAPTPGVVDHIGKDCRGMRFHSRDGETVLVAVSSANTIITLTLEGALVERVALQSTCDLEDVEIADDVSGVLVCCDVTANCLMKVTPGSNKGVGFGQFKTPVALAVVGKRLYVAESSTGRVHVLE